MLASQEFGTVLGRATMKLFHAFLPPTIVALALGPGGYYFLDFGLLTSVFTTVLVWVGIASQTLSSIDDDADQENNDDPN